VKTRTRTEGGINMELRRFFQTKEDVENVSRKLDKLEKTLIESEWFQYHEIVCSSLLFLLSPGRTNVYMIDFGKTIRHDVKIQHNVPWKLGNHEGMVFFYLIN
jgi:hypothetical protein